MIIVLWLLSSLCWVSEVRNVVVVIDGWCVGDVCVVFGGVDVDGVVIVGVAVCTWLLS